jgi:hypothetical protein
MVKQLQDGKYSQGEEKKGEGGEVETTEESCQWRIGFFFMGRRSGLIITDVAEKRWSDPLDPGRKDGHMDLFPVPHGAGGPPPTLSEWLSRRGLYKHPEQFPWFVLAYM